MWCDNEIIMIASWTDASPWPILQFLALQYIVYVICGVIVKSFPSQKIFVLLIFSDDEVPFLAFHTYDRNTIFKGVHCGATIFSLLTEPFYSSSIYIFFDS